MWQDWINAGFELMGGALVACHCLRLVRDKEVKGVSLFAVAGFTLWGFWNLYYYPALAQWTSFVGGLGVVTANCFWVCLILRYRRRPRYVLNCGPTQTESGRPTHFDDARRIVAGWPAWKRNIGHRLDP